MNPGMTMLMGGVMSNTVAKVEKQDEKKMVYISYTRLLLNLQNLTLIIISLHILGIRIVG